MKPTTAMSCVPLLAAVVLLMLLQCGPAAAIDKNKTAATSKCDTVCPSVYEPICGGLKPGAAGSDKPVTFGSSCVLNKYNCESSKDFVELSKGECPGKAAVRLS